jgi:hypothetical protein
MSVDQNSTLTYTELGMKVLGIKSTSSGNKTQRRMMIIKATTRRRLSLKAFPREIPPMLASIIKQIPTGGLIRPSARVMMVTIPRWTGWIPTEFPRA